MNNTVFAFEVSVKGHEDWVQVVNARTPGQAKQDYHRSVIDAWPGIPYIAMRCRKIGAPQSSERFINNARYRGLPDLRCGDRVRIGKNFGTVTGHDESANFIVLFDADAPKYAGMKLSVHPSEMEVVK